MTPEELAKVSKAMRDLGYSNAEIDACNGDQGALLVLMAAERSEVTRQGDLAAYGVRKQNKKTLKDIDDDVAKKLVLAAKKVT